MDPVNPSVNPASAPTPTPSAPVSGASFPQMASIGELFGAGWDFFAKNWKKVSPILVFPSVISFIAALLNTPHVGILTLISFILTIISIVLSIAMIPAVTDAVNRLWKDPMAAVALKTQYRFGFSLFWSTVLIVIISGLVRLGSIALLVIPGIIVSVYTIFCFFTFVIEGKKGFSALTSSYELVRGRWWPVFGRLLVFGVIFGVICAIVSLILSLIFGAGMVGVHTLGTVSVGSTAASSPLVAVASLIFNIILLGIIGPIAIGVLYAMYASLVSLRQPVQASSHAFKNWLIAFLVIGIIVLILIPIVLGVAFIAFSHFLQSNPNIQAMPAN